MASVKLAYGTNNQTITLTIASLTNNSARASTAVDNTTNLYTDYLVRLKVKSPASATAATGYINVYVVGTVDGGTTYGEAASGTDAAITLTSPTNATFLGSFNVVANATTYQADAMSVASAFRGALPDHFVVIIENKTGGTLDSAGGNHSATFQGVFANVA